MGLRPAGGPCCRGSWAAWEHCSSGRCRSFLGPREAQTESNLLRLRMPRPGGSGPSLAQLAPLGQSSLQPSASGRHRLVRHWVPSRGGGPFGPRHQPGEVIYEAARLRVLAEYGATRLKRPKSLRVHPTAANCTCKLPNPHSLHVKEPTRPSLGTYLDYLGAVSLQLHSPSLPSLSLARRRKRAAAVGWSASHAVRVREPQMQYSLLSLLLSTTAGEASSSSARR